MGKTKRQLRNFMLQPFLQVKLGLYNIVLGAIFSGTVVGVLYLSLGKFTRLVLELTDAESEVMDLLHIYLQDAKWWLGATVVFFMLANVVTSVVVTHRLIGPVIACRRQIRALAEGQYRSRVYLRDGDAFQDLAQDLNQLATTLQHKYGAKEDQPQATP